MYLLEIFVYLPIIFLSYPFTFREGISLHSRRWSSFYTDVDKFLKYPTLQKNGDGVLLLAYILGRDVIIVSLCIKNLISSHHYTDGALVIRCAPFVRDLFVQPLYPVLFNAYETLAKPYCKFLDILYLQLLTLYSVHKHIPALTLLLNDHNKYSR